MMPVMSSIDGERSTTDSIGEPLNKIVFGTKLISGQPVKYCQVLLEAGTDAEVYHYPSNRFGYQTATKLSMSRRARRRLFHELLERKPYAVHFWQSGILSPYLGSKDLLNEYDAYLLNGINVFHRFTGFDLRLPEEDIVLNRFSVYKHGVTWPFQKNIALAEYKKFLSSLLSIKDINFCVGDSELGRHLPNYYLTPRIFSLSDNDYSIKSTKSDQKFRILHAPSNPLYKGSVYVERAINQLRSEGYQFEFVRIEGMSHSRVLEELSHADLVVDQLLIGAPGVFTLEAWSHGIPVACYFCDDVIKDYNCEPVLNCNPDNIYSILKDVIGGRSNLEFYSRLGFQVFNTFHSPSAIQDMLVDLYANNATKIAGSSPIITKTNLIVKKYSSWNLNSFAEPILDRSLPVSINSYVGIVSLLSGYIRGQLMRWPPPARAIRRMKEKRILGGIKRQLNRLRSRLVSRKNPD